MKYYFIFICKSSCGSIYPSSIMCSADELQDTLANFSNCGVRVIDVKLFTFNSADYE